MIKDSVILPVLEEMQIGVDFDSRYQGIQKELSNAVIPFKKVKITNCLKKRKNIILNYLKDELK